MSENEPVARRRRNRPVNQEPPKRIIIGSEASQPDWMVSANSVSGAASRRTGIPKSLQTDRQEAPSENKNTQETVIPLIPKESQKGKESGGKEASQKKTQSTAQAVSSGTGNRNGRTIAVADSAVELVPKKKGTGTAQKTKSNSQSSSARMEKPVKASKKKKRKKSSIGKWIALGVLGVAVIVGAVFGIREWNRCLDIKNTLDRGENSFYQNIYMNDMPLEGYSLNEAVAVVSQQVEALLSSFKITLRTVDGRSWDITKDDLQMKYDVADQLDLAWAIGHTGSSAERYEQIKALEENEVRRYTTMSYDLSKVNQILTQIKEEVDEPAVNAQRIDDDTKWPPYSYTDDTPGQTLDITGLNERIMGMVDRLESGTVELTPVPVEAKVTRKALEESIVKLATYETTVGATSHEGRFTNIRIGTEKFNHLIVHAGETVSFNKVTGKRTEANGFVEAPEIAYGEYVMGIGGGICQVSSTMYNAVVNAGLEVIKRTQHSLASNYVPMGQDATVSDDRLDFTFRNNTGADIFFETQYYKKKNYWCTSFTIYGRPDPNGYTYKLESQVREEIPLPDPTYRPDRHAQYVVYDNQTYQISKGEVGYIVDVYLVTTDSTGVQISRDLKYTDTYKAVAPVYWIGVTPRE